MRVLHGVALVWNRWNLRGSNGSNPSLLILSLQAWRRARLDDGKISISVASLNRPIAGSKETYFQEVLLPPQTQELWDYGDFLLSFETTKSAELKRPPSITYGIEAFHGPCGWINPEGDDLQSQVSCSWGGVDLDKLLDMSNQDMAADATKNTRSLAILVFIFQVLCGTSRTINSHWVFFARKPEWNS